MKVSVNYRGKIKGMDRVLTAALGVYAALDYERADELRKEFGRLLKEIAELAWVCRERAEQSGRYFGYEMEVFVTEQGVTWQRYRTEADPPPPLADHLNARHCWQTPMSHRYDGEWNLVIIPPELGTLPLRSSHLFHVMSRRVTLSPSSVYDFGGSMSILSARFTWWLAIWNAAGQFGVIDLSRSISRKRVMP